MKEFLEEFAARIEQAAKKPNVLNYKVNSETHETFHKSEKLGRILKGGNRSGKTVAGCVEGIWRSLGTHPFHPTHEIPTRGRIVTVDKDNGIEQIIKPVLAQWTPPSGLINGSWEDSWSNQSKVLTLANKSTIQVKTHQQEVESFAGIPLHWTWFDEECPQAIFQECRLRLIDYNGVWWMTMTPVEGMDWINDRFLATGAKNVDVFDVDITDNPHLNKIALELLNEDLSDEEKEIRQKGIFVPRGGFIFKKFNYDKHVIVGGRPVPKGWTVYVSVDHGFNNPTAILWHAVSPSMDVITFAEHYKSKMIIKNHAQRIREINKQWNVHPELYTCDPSMSQKTAESGTSPLQLYRDYGIPLVPAKKDVDGRINKMNEYFEFGKWHITEDCPNTIKEVKGYSFKVYTSPKIADRNNVMEQPNKKNDHCPDSAGYFFNWMPYLQSEHKNTVSPRTVSQTEVNPTDFPWQVDTQLMGGDDNHDGSLAFGEIY